MSLKLHLSLLAGGLLSTAVSVNAATPAASASSPMVETIKAVRSDVSPPLSELLRSSPTSFVGPTTEIPNILLKPTPLDTYQPLWLADLSGVQTAPLGTPVPAPLQSFNGLSLNGSLPPDTNADVSDTHVIQWVNTQWNVFNKATGLPIGSPMEGNIFWAGFGGVCETNDAGDPIVLYDDTAERWVFSQFTGSTTPRQCFAISQTSDPLGPYIRYEFVFPRFNDYPHIGIWQDASTGRDGYYFVVHEFLNGAFQGAAFVAVDRNRMLAGAPAAQVSMLRFPGIDAYGALPAHLEGTTKAQAGACAPFVHFDNNTSEYLFWDLCADWTTPANSTLSATPTRVAASAPFSNAIGSSPQAGTSQGLDTFANNLMYRASARAFPTGAPTETSIVVNHTVNAGGTELGVRWAHFDLRAPATISNGLFADGFESSIAAAPMLLTKRLVEDGVYSPDTDNRWMGGINIDRNGYLGIGYSVSSTTLNPQIRYTGRIFDTQPGMLLDEASCTAGIANGSQTSTSGRWGDYASMSTDPDDECTFWFTSEYLATTSNAGWTTRICSFRFPECGQPDFRLVPESATHFEICAATASDPVVDFRAGVVSGQSGDATLSLSGLAGVTPSFSANPLALPSAGSVTLDGATSLASGEYSGALVASANGKDRSLPVTLSVSSAAPATATLGGAWQQCRGSGDPANPELDCGTWRAALSRAGGDRCGLRQHRVRPDRGSHQRGDQCAVGQHHLLLARAGHQPLRKRRGLVQLPVHHRDARKLSGWHHRQPGVLRRQSDYRDRLDHAGRRGLQHLGADDSHRNRHVLDGMACQQRQHSAKRPAIDLASDRAAVGRPKSAAAHLPQLPRVRDRWHYRLLGRRSVGHQHRQRRQLAATQQPIVDRPLRRHQLGRHQPCRWRCADVVSIRRRRAQLSGRPQRLWG
jgi:hypothetical protein